MTVAEMKKVLEKYPDECELWGDRWTQLVCAGYSGEERKRHCVLPGIIKRGRA